MKIDLQKYKRNAENILCNKCDNEIIMKKYYIKKDRGKERKLLRCKRIINETRRRQYIIIWNSYYILLIYKKKCSSLKPLLHHLTYKNKYGCRRKHGRVHTQYAAGTAPYDKIATRCNIRSSI